MDEINNPLSGSSIPEQTVFFYVKSIFPDAINRYRVFDGTLFYREADIFIPSIMAAIEYDGVRWHENTELQDIEKNKYFEWNKIYLIRIRENGLKSLEMNYGRTIFRSESEYEFNETIEEVMHALGELCKDSSQRLSALSFKLSYLQICLDTPKIASTIYKVKTDKNITNSCAYSYWDHERNKAADPKCIPLNTSMRFWYICPEGKHVFHNEVLKRCDDSEEEACNYCTRSYICPFMDICEGTDGIKGYYGFYMDEKKASCSRITEFAREYVNGRKGLPYKYLSDLQYSLCNYPKLIIDLMRQLIDEETSEEKRERIEKLLLKSDEIDGYRTSYLSLEEREYYKNNGISVSRFELCCGELSSPEDLEVIKKVIQKYHCEILFSLYLFDETEERWQMFCDFANWYISFFHRNIRALSFFLKNISMNRRRIEKNISKKFTFKIIKTIEANDIIKEISEVYYQDSIDRFSTEYSVYSRFISMKKDLYSLCQIPIDLNVDKHSNTDDKQAIEFDQYEYSHPLNAPYSDYLSDREILRIQIQYVIEEEQPIHWDEFLKRMALAFHSLKVTDRVKRNVESCLRNELKDKVIIRGNFLYTDIDKPILARKPKIKERPRPIDHIADEEIQDAMQKYIHLFSGISQKELFNKTLEVFGINESGQKANLILQRCIREMENKNEIRMINKKVYVSEDTLI